MMEIRKKILDRCFNPKDSILHALKKMDVLGVKSLLVVSDNLTFLGVLSIGDIQRAIIRNESLENSSISILRKNPRFVTAKESIEFIKSEMIRYRMEFMPVVNDSKEIIDVYFWEDLFSIDINLSQRKVNMPVVIMAGGMGNRLRPLTNVFPKPLIPYGEKTIVEEIIQRLVNQGCTEFYLSLGYKADLIEYYLRRLQWTITINYFREEKYLGTAGSLNLLKGRILKTFIISNCDILINQPLDEIVEYHKENKNEITLVAALKHYPIPYGILETTKNGKLKSISEKPELTFKINTGLYILEPHLIDEIPADTVFHITQLVEKLQTEKRMVGVFPVSERSWIDIGEWTNYLDILNTRRSVE